jgi:hypothetical protein
LRSAPCRPRQSGGFLPRATQPPQQQSAARHASLWICGQHKSVAHKPTGPTATADNLNELKISRVRTTPGAPSKAALKATRHGCYNFFRRLYAGPDSHSQAGPGGTMDAAAASSLFSIG